MRHLSAQSSFDFAAQRRATITAPKDLRPAVLPAAKPVALRAEPPATPARTAVQPLAR